MKQLPEADRQVVVLSLACLSLARPGWQWYLGDVATREFAGEKMFDEFRLANEDRGAAASIATSGVFDLIEGLATRHESELVLLLGAVLGHLHRRGVNVDAVMAAADDVTRLM